MARIRSRCSAVSLRASGPGFFGLFAGPPSFFEKGPTEASKDSKAAAPESNKPQQSVAKAP